MNPDPPKVLFGAGSLSRGRGGIAELSRQVFETLLEMYHKQLINLTVHVLQDADPASADPLFAERELPRMRWYAGSRMRFAAGTAAARADLHLFDHVGLARPGAIRPLRSGQLVILIHSVEMWRVKRADYRDTARRADLLIANSGYTARRTQERIPGLPPMRVCWPGLGAPTSSRNANGGRPQEIGPHAVLIVGRLDAQQRHKGHDQLLEAMPLIIERVPNARLVVAGGGDDRDRLEAKARELGVVEHVLFLGWVDEATLLTLYDQCAVFAMPSDGDGFGLVFLEAMMYGLPCVGLMGGAAAEIFEHEVSGILVDREDRAGMAQSLASLLLDRERRQRIGQAGFERYRQQFTGRHYTERLSSILREQLGLNGASG